MKKLFNALDKVEEFASSILFLGAAAVMLYGVFMRYVMNAPQFGILEIVRILLPWAIFIGFGRALKENHHIAVDVVYDLLPFSAKRVVAVISNLFGVGFAIFMVMTGLETVRSEYETGYLTVALAIPIWITYIIMPISMVLLGIYFAVKAYRAAIGDKKEVVGEITHLEHEQFVKDDQKGEMSV